MIPTERIEPSAMNNGEAGVTGLLNCLFCGKPIAEGDCHTDDSGESAHKDCAIAEFLAQVREERERATPSPESIREGALREAAEVAVQFIDERLYKPQFPACSYHAGELRADIINLIPSPPTLPVSTEESGGVVDVLAERRRQIEAEGWTPEHDDAHTGGELAQAAAAYAYYATDAENGQPCAETIFPSTWSDDWFKPTDHRRNLVKAGALILAEIERLDRAAPKQSGEQT